MEEKEPQKSWKLDEPHKLTPPHNLRNIETQGDIKTPEVREKIPNRVSAKGTSSKFKYWKERESLRQKTLEQENQQRKLEQAKQKYWKQVENLRDDPEYSEVQYQQQKSY